MPNEETPLSETRSYHQENESAVYLCSFIRSLVINTNISNDSRIAHGENT